MFWGKVRGLAGRERPPPPLLGKWEDLEEGEGAGLGIAGPPL